MALSDMAIKKAKPREKIYTLKDADGLYLEIKPSGKKYWRLRYWIEMGRQFRTPCYAAI